jgi:hypothetical protein
MPALDSGTIAINTIRHMNVGEVVVAETPIFIAASSQTQNHQADQ